MDIKKELRAFFSVSGHSALLDTKSVLKKVFWLSCMSALLVSGMLLSYKNLMGYQAHDVVTQIKVIDDHTITFPAVTFCLSRKDVRSSYSIISKLEGQFVGCIFENFDSNCTLDNLEHVSINASPYYDENYDCFKFKFKFIHSVEIILVIKLRYCQHQKSELIRPKLIL